MRPLPSTVIAPTAAILCAMLVAACEAKVHGAPLPAHQFGPHAIAQPLGVDFSPEAPPDASSAILIGLDVRVNQATQDASKNGATISMMLHDRFTQHTVSSGNGTPLAIASVAKLFIADDLLMQDAKGVNPLSAEDRQALDSMLRSSDDDAAERFWNRGGSEAIVARVAARYGLTSTGPPDDGHWWNTVSTAADLVRYYDMLLDGTGGLPPERTGIIVNDLAQSTPQGVDGYSQRFGIPEGLYAERVAVKQGWMCCIGSDWMHLSTGVIGADHRYTMVISSQQTSDDATARTTISQAVKTMFPSGHISQVPVGNTEPSRD
jgi:hypothetical protein